MTHLIQLSVDMDDDSIRKQCVNHTAAMIEKALFDGGRYVENDFYGVRMSSAMKRVAEEQTAGFLEAHKDEIITAAAAMLADKLARSKKGKEILNGF